jgi:hypothetical protein
MEVIVTAPYRRPFEDPIAVHANDTVIPDFEKQTDIEGWVWCMAVDGRSGWTPRAWLVRSNGRWQVDRDFNAIELTVETGEVLIATLEESGFYWATKRDGQSGWVPCSHVAKQT